LRWLTFFDLQLGMKSTERLTQLELTTSDRATLRARASGRTREQLSARKWRRIRTLLLLDEGESVRATARAVGGYPREVSRVGKRYLAGGLEHALSDDPRPHPEKKLDSTQEAAVVAMVCGPTPEGRARWTVRLVAEQAVKKRIVDKIGRETIRLLFASRGLKPWREKNVVRPGAH
jgi:putative transposase